MLVPRTKANALHIGRRLVSRNETQQIVKLNSWVSQAPHQPTMFHTKLRMGYKIMNLDKMKFEIGYSQGFYYIEFNINQKAILRCEFLDFFKNILNLVEIGFALQRKSLRNVHYFVLDDYSREVKFKASPNPPMDWLVLDIPNTDNAEKFYFDRLVFCEALESSIVGFMREKNMDYLGNPNRSKSLDKYDNEIWKIISHDWV